MGKTYFDVAGKPKAKAEKMISAGLKALSKDFPQAVDMVAEAISWSDGKMADEVSVNDRGNLVVYGWCSGAPTSTEITPSGEVVDSYNGECDDQGY